MTLKELRERIAELSKDFPDDAIVQFELPNDGGTQLWCDGSWLDVESVGWEYAPELEYLGPYIVLKGNDKQFLD